jgi:hypothetical protein
MDLSKGAIELIAQNIHEIDSELRDVEFEAKKIEDKRQALLSTRDALRKVIGADATELASNPPKPATITGDGILKSEDASIAATGFRASIRSVCKAASKGLRPRDVYEELAKRGVPYAGKTDPVVRTSTEMWRMQKVGQLRKRGQLYYAQESAQGG